MNRVTRLAAASLLLISAGFADASLIGKPLTASYRFPDAETVYMSGSFAPPSFTVGSGTETVGDIEGVTTLTVDFSATSLEILLKTTLNSPTWNVVSFNGIRFDAGSDAAGTLGITGATVAAGTTMTGFTDSRVTFGDDFIGINWNGLSYVDGTRVIVDFAFAPIPEPSTWLMLAGGLGLLGFALRRRAPLTRG